MPRRRMTAKQLKFFGTKAQRSAIRRRKSPTGVGTMVRRRRSFSMPRFRRYHRAGRNMLTGAIKPVIGGGVYGLIEPAMNGIPLLNTQLGKVAVGAFASNKSGVIGDTAKALLSVESYRFSRGMAGNVLSGVGATASAYIN